MNKDSCTVSRLVNLSVILSLKFFFCRHYNQFLPLYRFENWNLFFLTGPNKCGFSNGGCSHLCLPAPTEYNAAGYACACPDNMVLMSGKQCRESGKWSLFMSSVHITATLSKSPKRRMQVIALIVGRDFNVQFHLHLSCVYVTALTWL